MPSTQTDLKEIWRQLVDGARRRRGLDQAPWQSVTLPSGTHVMMRYGLSNPPRRRVLIFREGPTDQSAWDAELIGLVRGFGLAGWQSEHDYTRSGGQRADFISPREES